MARGMRMPRFMSDHMDETEEMSSGRAREAILSQHVVLRTLLDEMVAAADAVNRDRGAADLARRRARLLFDSLATHMSYEEHVLAAALGDVIGWGAILHERLVADHARQREQLSAAIAALGSGHRSLSMLVQDLRAFAEALLHDMETEEAGLATADIDALVVDGKGG